MLSTLRKLIGWLFLYDEGLAMNWAPTISSDLIAVSFMVKVIGGCIER
ncbi:BgtTE-56016 [Blumeria graminis f. sp. tritici]|uniref:BgtTE-56016 n=1 Tax=Blumeria graminis f. sp. tritici TaxID=62690 RepID=A0A9X9L997_BLUGR|nr:BgtTE-56016 [Blumeria graminis f. sp. tritici]